MREAGLSPHIKCFAHTLNLASQAGLNVSRVSRLLGRVRKVVAFFHRSVTATAVLTENHREFLRYENSFPPTFPEDILAPASPNDWPIVAKHANTSSRGSINAAPVTITSESFSSLC